MYLKHTHFYPHFPLALIRRTSFWAYAPNIIISQLDLEFEPTIPALMHQLHTKRIDQETYEAACFKAYLTGDANHLRLLSILNTKRGDPFHEITLKMYDEVHKMAPTPCNIYADLDKYVPVGVLPVYIEQRKNGGTVPLRVIDKQARDIANAIGKSSQTLEANHLKLNGRRMYLQGMTPSMTVIKKTRTRSELQFNAFSTNGQIELINFTLSQNRYPFLKEFGYVYYGNPGSNVWVSLSYMEKMLDAMLKS